MSILSYRMVVCALVVLAAVGGTSRASAQAGVLWTAAGGMPVCDTLALGSCASDAECPAVDQTCREFENGVRSCVSADQLFCTREKEGGPPCPLDRTTRVRVLDVAFCVSEDYVVCDTAARGGCFTAVSGDFPVDWDYGDCDGDGQENALDPLPCEPAPYIATLDPDGACMPGRDLCAEDSDCAAGLSCHAVVVDDPHGYCVASEGTAFCCGGIIGVECPDAFECTPEIPDGFDLCHEYCEELPFEQRVGCVKYGGDYPVDPDLGDCDGDGLRNEDEVEAATDPCVPDDAGVPMPEPDAGSTVDADAGTGETMDGSTTEQPPVSFTGGGGCRCGVASSQRTAMPWGLVLVALALWRTTARRRRA